MCPAQLFNFGVEHPLAFETFAEFILAQLVVIAQFDFKRIVAKLQGEMRHRDADVAIESQHRLGSWILVQNLHPLENVYEFMF